MNGKIFGIPLLWVLAGLAVVLYLVNRKRQPELAAQGLRGAGTATIVKGDSGGVRFEQYS